MIQGAPPMSALATFLVVLKIWRTFRDPQNAYACNGRFSETSCLFITLSLPYIVFIVFLLVSLVLQIKVPQSLSANNGLYCTTYGISFRRYSVPSLSIIMLALMFGFEVAIAIRYYRSRRRIITSFPLAHRSTSLGLIIRIALFNLYLFVTFGASIVFLSGRTRPWPYMIQAAPFLLFATQKNVILAWCFWLKNKKAIPTRSDENMPPLRRAGDPSELDLSHIPISARDAASSPHPIPT
ncbi:hypothetical protein BDZ97DRAFT_375198 [Flammula alnicola]|nr:hypothetical protein BDZ97DRAFT_375198 [Flammula alnicola]